MNHNGSSRILVVEDKASEREALARLLKLEHYDVVTADSASCAIGYLREPIDLVISDLKMSKATGLDLLRYWKDRRRETPFIMVTAFGDVDSAVEAMKLGAEDYLNKPVNPEEMLLLVARCLEAQSERRNDCGTADTAGRTTWLRTRHRSLGSHVGSVRACTTGGDDR